MPRERQHGFKLESVRLDFGKLTPLAIVMFGHVCEIGHVPMFFVCFGRYKYYE